MHRALLVNDIVHIILQNVKSSATDMIHFACTCSTLSPPALDILWRVQFNLGPLIMCLPQDTWEIRDNVIHLSREPLPAEWERVRVNASRMRRLVSNTRDIHSNCPPKVHSRVLQTLFALFPPTSLFLNLSDLDFSAVADIRDLTPKLQFSFLRRFLSPGLGFLAFLVPSGAPAQELEEFVDILPVEASGLRQLVIAAETDGAPPREIHLPLVKMQKLNALGILRNACLTKHSIAATEHMRSLRALALHLKGSDTLEGSDDIPLLSLLECLALDADNIQHCTSFLLRVSTPRLSSLGIKYNKHALPDEVNDFFVSLHTSCPAPASLKSIFVHRHGDDSHRDLELENLLPSHVFRPLLKFRRLTTVKFLSMGEYCLDDDFIQDAAVAWPDIQELWFASKQTNSSVTFGAMLSLASRCRSLRSLQLTFDATKVPLLPHRKENEDSSQGSRELWPKQTSFQALHVGNSKLPRPAFVPFILVEVFPNLFDISSYQSHRVTDYINWRHVGRSLRELVSLREKDPRLAADLSKFVVDMLVGY